MTATPKLPWASLALLFLTDATFGWLLHDWTDDRELWLIMAFALTIISAMVAYPSRSVAMVFGHFFRTDTRALILIVVGSLMSVVLLTWAQIFVDLVILSAAGLLVSLDLKVRGWSKPISMFLIIGWQLLGLSTGLGFYYLYAHPLIDLPEYFYDTYWLKLIKQLINI